jgi:hypothetical protein
MVGGGKACRGRQMKWRAGEMKIVQKSGRRHLVLRLAGGKACRGRQMKWRAGEMKIVQKSGRRHLELK